MADISRKSGKNLGTHAMSERRQFGASPFIAAMAVAAVGCFGLALPHWHSGDPVKFICYMAAALLASPLKVSLPGGTLSVNFLFTLLSIQELGLPEVLLIGMVSTLGQFYWKPVQRLQAVQLIFNLSQVTVAATIGYGTFQLISIYVLHGRGPLA